MEETFFRVRAPEVTFEDFKNEILIIDLKTGHYHSLRGPAAHIWRLVNAGQSVNGCVGRLKSLYPTEPAVESDAKSFLLELEQQGLIDHRPEPVAATDVASEVDAEKYSKPTINSYGDLQDLLLLDPIHEVSPEAGWPHRRENGQG